VTLIVQRGNQIASITLKKVAYIPGYVANIFSLSCSKKIYFNSKTNTLSRKDGSLFIDLDLVGGYWFLNAQDATQLFQVMAAASTQEKPTMRRLYALFKVTQTVSKKSFAMLISTKCGFARR
jgi:hypothetical protein